MAIIIKSLCSYLEVTTLLKNRFINCSYLEVTTFFCLCSYLEVTTLKMAGKKLNKGNKGCHYQYHITTYGRHNRIVFRLYV